MKILAAFLIACGVSFAQYFPPIGSGGGSGCVPSGGANLVLIGDGGGGCGPTTTAAGLLTFFGTPSSANLLALLTTKTGTGSAVFGTGPTFIGPHLGTPADGNASNLSNLPITLTTTGSSGPATWTQGTNTLNIPQYSGGASGITIGTTTITSGTNTRILFDNSSVVGEYAVGTGIPTFFATPSGANLASALTTPLTSTGGGLGAALNGAAAHSTIISNGASPAVYAAKVIADCQDTGGNHLNFTQSSDAFSCGTSGGSPSHYWLNSLSTGIGPASFTPSATFDVYDATPSTGTTLMSIREGANQGTSAAWRVRNNADGANWAHFDLADGFQTFPGIHDGLTDRAASTWAFDSTSHLALSSGFVIGFVSTSPISINPFDLGLSRVSSGVLGVGTGAAGSHAGTLQAATIIIDNSSFTFNGHTCTIVSTVVTCP